MYHDRMKHMEIDHHFIKEKIEKGIIKLLHMSTSLQIVDILTKTLPRKNFEDLNSKLGLVNIYSPT